MRLSLFLHRFLTPEWTDSVNLNRTIASRIFLSSRFCPVQTMRGSLDLSGLSERCLRRERDGPAIG